MRKTALFLSVCVLSFASFGETVAPKVCESAALWLDASQTNTMTFSGREIVEWRSIHSGLSATTYSLTGSNQAATPSGPVLKEDDVSSLPVVSFGSTRSNRDLGFDRLTNVKAVFMVAKVEKSAHAFLLGDSEKFNFHRGNEGQFWHTNHGAAQNGVTHLNGVVVASPTATTMPESFSLIDVQASGDNAWAASQLCYDRTGNGNDDPRRGGKDIAEVLVFTNALTTAEQQTVRDYLMEKWRLFGAGEAAVVRAHPRLTLGLERESLIGVRLLDGASGALTNLSVRFDVTNAVASQIRDVRVWRQKYDASAEILPFAFFERDAVDLTANGLAATRIEEGDDALVVNFAVTNKTDALTVYPKTGTMAEGDYLWITATLDRNLATNAEIWSSIQGDRVALASGDFRLARQKARAPHRPFPHKFQIGAFVRQDSLVDNGSRTSDIFTGNEKERFENLTDVLPIYSAKDGYSNGKFYVSGWDSTHNDTASTARLRRLRDAYHPDCMIRPSLTPKSWVTANGVKNSLAFEVAGAAEPSRKQFAEAIVAFIQEQQCDGLDIDYEWVREGTNHREWQNIGKMLRELSEQFFDEGYVLSFAVRSHDEAGSGMPYSACDYGAFHVCDYMMVQSYGAGWLNSAPSVHERSLGVCTKRLLPKRRVVMGQAAYVSADGHPGWDGAAWKIESETTDPFRRFDMDIWWKSKYSSYWPFEGMSSLQGQCLWARREELGGVMSWGYYTDPTWDGWCSFARHQSKAVWPMPNAWKTPETVERDGETWYQIKTEDDWFFLAENPAVHAELANDIVFEHDPLVIDEWTGVLDGQGHTLVFDDDTWIVSEKATGLVRSLRGTIRNLAVQMNARVFTLAARWHDQPRDPADVRLVNTMTGENPVGVVAAEAGDGAVLENVSVVLGPGSEVKGVQSVGGIVGKASGSAALRNCSVEVGGKVHLEVRNIWDTLFQPSSPAVGALVGLVEGDGVLLENNASSVVEGGSLQDLDDIPAPAYELAGDWREPTGFDMALPRDVDVRSGDWALEVVFSLPAFSTSFSGYPQLVSLVGESSTVSLSVNGDGAGELFLTGSSTATYAYPLSRAVVRGNGDVGSGVALAPGEDARVTILIENRGGELRLSQNGETFLVTDKNNGSAGYLRKALLGRGLSQLGGGEILSVRLKIDRDEAVIHPGGYGKLVFDDEFDGDALDATKWEKVPVMTSGAPNWRQYTSHREDLVAVSNGCLVLTGVLNDRSDGDTRKFLCGQIQSSGKFSFKYGKVEIRAKFEDQSGAWPAMWMMPQDSVHGGWPYSGEIDITERLNSDAFVHQTAHFGKNDRDSTSTTQAAIDTGAFNVYGLEWTEDKIVWTVNGAVTHSYANDGGGSLTWPFDADFYFILSQQLEGSWVGQVSDTSTLPVRMFVDYVRVWQRDEDDLRENAYLWLDASDDSTVVTNEAGDVVAWKSANLAGKSASAYSLASESPQGPERIVDDDGRPLLSFGSTSANRDLAFERTTALRTLFMVARLEEGPNAFLLGDSSSYDFHRGESGELFSSGNASACIRDGTTYLDGLLTDDPTATTPSDALMLFEVHTTNGVAASQLCYDRAGNGSVPRRGGKDIAELVLFEEALDEAASAKIRRTLIEKWRIGATAVWTMTNEGVVKEGAAVPTLIHVLNDEVDEGAEIGNSEELAALSAVNLIEAKKPVTLSFSNDVARIVAGADTRLTSSNAATLVVCDGMKATLAEGVGMGAYELASGGTLRRETDFSTGIGTDAAFVAGNAGTYEFRKILFTGGLQPKYNVRVQEGDEIVMDGEVLNGRSCFSFDVRGGRVVFPAKKTTWVESARFTQSGGEFISLATGQGQTSTTNGFMLGFNGSAMTLDITGGLFAVTNSSVNFYNPVTLNVGGTGVVRAKGYFKAGSQATVNVNSGGSLEVGSLGFKAGSAVLNLKGGTLRGYEKDSVVHDNVNLLAPSVLASAPDGSLTIDGTLYYGSTVTLAAGSTLTLPSGGALTFVMAGDCAGVKVTDGLLDFGTTRAAALSGLSGTGTIRVTLTDAERAQLRTGVRLFAWSGASYAGRVTVVADGVASGELVLKDGFLTFVPPMVTTTTDAAGNAVYQCSYPNAGEAPVEVGDLAYDVSVASTVVVTAGAMMNLPESLSGDVVSLAAGGYRIFLESVAEDDALLLRLGYEKPDGTRTTTGFGAGVRVAPGVHAVSLSCSATNGVVVALDGVVRDEAASLKFSSELFTGVSFGAAGVGLYAVDVLPSFRGVFAYPYFASYPAFDEIVTQVDDDPLVLTGLETNRVGAATVFAVLASPSVAEASPLLKMTVTQNATDYLVEALRETDSQTRLAYRPFESGTRLFAAQTVSSRETTGSRVWHLATSATGGTTLDVNGKSAVSSPATKWGGSFVKEIALGCVANVEIGPRQWIVGAAEAATEDDPLAGLVETPAWYETLDEKTQDYLFAKVGARVSAYEMPEITVNGEIVSTNEALTAVRYFAGDPAEARNYELSLEAPRVDGDAVGLSCAGDDVVNAALQVLSTDSLTNAWRVAAEMPPRSSARSFVFSAADGGFFRLRACEPTAAEGQAGMPVVSSSMALAPMGSVAVDGEGVVQLEGAGVAEGLTGYLTVEGCVYVGTADADGRLRFDLPQSLRGQAFPLTLVVPKGSANGDVRVSGSSSRALVTEVVADSLYGDGFATSDFGSYRIPSLVTDGDGEILCLYDVRYGGGDLGTGDGIDIGETTSHDFGKTFSTPHLAIDVVNKRANDGTQREGWSKDWDIGDVSTLYDPATQTYWLMAITGKGLFGRTTALNDVVMYTRARGDGALKWENRTSVQSLIAAQPGVATATGALGFGFLAGPGHGFVTTKDVSYVTTNGVASVMPKGTLVFPMQYFVDGSFTASSVGALYSTDHGATWLVTARSATADGPQENCVMELDDGSWYMTAKAGTWGGDLTTETGKFKFFRSTDFSTWTAVGELAPVPCQQGSCLKLGVGADGRGRYVLCHTMDRRSGVRARLSLVFGRDTTADGDAAGIAWDFENPVVLYAEDTGTKGYNSLCLVDAKTLGVLYEARNKIYFIRIDVSDVLR